MPALRLQDTVNELFFEVSSSTRGRQPVLVSAILERDAEGSPTSAMLVLYEAAQRRQYERELLAARKEFEQIAEVVGRSSDAILRLSKERLILSWNEGAGQIFGYTLTEISLQPFHALLTEVAGEDLRNQIEHQESGSDAVLETMARRKDGTVVNVSIRLTPHVEPPGRIVGYSAIIRDITSRKLAERALLQADKLASVGRLASSIAHELNNPLEAVTNLLYLLETGAKDEDTRTLVVTAQSELARVSHIATHTLRFHRQLTRKTKTNLALLFGEMIALYKDRFIGSGIEAVVDVNGTQEMECYESELRQVLLNLISNSFDAMRHGGHLLLRSRQTTHWPSGEEAIRISVQDDGTGLSAEACQQLFEPFFSTKGINGAGLGLWISKDLVSRNHGSIKIRSSTRLDSHGTIVSLLFRIASREDAAKSPTAVFSLD